jgi:hypothetical protein
MTGAEYSVFCNISPDRPKQACQTGTSQRISNLRPQMLRLEISIKGTTPSKVEYALRGSTRQRSFSALGEWV